MGVSRTPSQLFGLYIYIVVFIIQKNEIIMQYCTAHIMFSDFMQFESCVICVKLCGLSLKPTKIILVWIRYFKTRIKISRRGGLNTPT